MFRAKEKNSKKRQASHYGRDHNRFMGFFSFFLKSVICLGVVISGVIGVQWLRDPNHFPITEVELLGDIQYTATDTIRTQIADELNAGFFGTKISKLRAVLLSLPWIQNVEIDRVWPSKLVITLKEHEPFAKWNDTFVITRKGVLIHPDLNSIPDGLPVLQGPQMLFHQVWQHYLEMSQILNPYDLTISRVILAPRGAWQVRLSNNSDIILGTWEVNDRLKRFVKIYSRALKEKGDNIRYFDLRYTSGLAVGWKTN
ncbi:MAG TPA: cell division protein FtsQ/DivIB [Gammaproteobacteria bacterium]|nr:cell division protein FtsQ/DivIB [Gammaproteobacteria bacterium]